MPSVYVCQDSPAPADPASCAVWQVQPFEPSPFALSVEQAQGIAVSILGVWAVAWVCRVIARIINQL